MRPTVSNMMIAFVTPALAFGALSYPASRAIAQEPAFDAVPTTAAGFSLAFGYKLIDIGAQTYSHDTHPNDSFLPNANVPGSAGTTSLDGRISMAAIGARYTQPVSGPFYATFEVGLLVSYDVVDEKNANDTRPDSDASFIYSRAALGAYASAGLAYKFGRFSLGATAQVAAVEIENGWDRPGRYYSNSWIDDFQVDYYTTEYAWSVGPTFGYQFDDQLALEATVSFGDRVTGGLMLVWSF